MASQVSHIVYAKRLFDALEDSEKISSLRNERNLQIPDGFDKDLFLLGCTFPDIRRIDRKIKRKDTHLRFEPLDLDFSSLGSFEAGWKFHLYCDMRREEILNGHGFYSLKGTTDFFCGPAKLLEDELIYNDYNNWEKIISYFRNVPSIEIGIDVDKETFSLWYAILAKYMEEQPTTKTMRVFMSKQFGIGGDLNDIMETVDNLRKNKKAVEIILKINNEII
ncbi:MAG: hypothetical protein HGB08_00055 [Candidatus Moranbacteria bacterium]|nr:hypothetical protein [Candidatus Moranbacteria bacterium]